MSHRGSEKCESRAPGGARRRDHAHGHADPEGCTYGNCKNGCEVLAELGLEAKPGPPSPLHAQHTMHAPASASASLYMRRRRGIRLLVPVAAATEVATAAATVAATAAAMTTAASTHGKEAETLLARCM